MVVLTTWRLLSYSVGPLGITGGSSGNPLAATISVSIIVSEKALTDTLTARYGNGSGCERRNGHRLLIQASDTISAHETAMPNGPRNIIVDGQRHNLTTSTECGHELWAAQNGTFRCEECRHILPRFIYQCSGCGVLACQRCRRKSSLMWSLKATSWRGRVLWQ